MDKTTLKAKAKETKDQVVGFVRHHWKDLLLVGGAIILSAVAVACLSSQRSDEENENVFDKDDDNFDSDSYEDDDDYGEALSVWNAADIYLSSGFDEDYRFGYTHEELMEALGE
jgi:hypothetical protein